MGVSDIACGDGVCLVRGAVVVSEGMGLTGRQVPMPDNTVVPLSGRLRRVEL